jgi:hypothetical protein
LSFRSAAEESAFASPSAVSGHIVKMSPQGQRQIDGMTEIPLPGWTKVGTRDLVHHCGARISGQRRDLWTAQTVGGASTRGFLDARLASEWLQANDPDFWSIGKLASVGIIAGILLVSGSYDSKHNQILNVWSVPDGTDFPAYHQATFKRLFLQRAVCAKCGSKTTAIQLRRLVYVDRESEYRNNLVCDCGYPVWRMSVSDFFSADDELVRAERHWKRKANLSEAGGNHSAKEIEEIRSLQRNRCIYCNALFVETLRPTKDHLVPIIDGGTDWAFNIVLACRRCNSHRREIPFWTYCKTLSESQNRRIASHLRRRLRALGGVDSLPEDVLSAFRNGVIADVLRIGKP